MAWIVLVVSGALESVWAAALSRSDGFTRLWPSVIFFVATAASMGGLAYALKFLPLGTAYAVWVGIGATLTVLYAVSTGQEAVSLVKVLFLLMIIGGVIGLKAVH